jgi:hypothetical protein
MIFKRIRQIRAILAPRKRVSFSWSKNQLSALIPYLQKSGSSFKRFLRRNRVKAWVYAYVLLVLWSPFIQIGTAHAPVMAAEDIQRIEAQVARQKELAQLREELQLFLERYHSELGSDYIEAVIAVEEDSQLAGFSKLATAIALNESYLGKVYPKGSYNLWGLGASTPQRWIDYDSWDEGAADFYRVVRKLGMKEVTYQELLRISRTYVGTSKWQQWGDKIWRFYLQI